MTDIDHDAAERIARDIGKTYQWPGDDAVRLVFAAYLDALERLRNAALDAARADAARLREEIEALKELHAEGLLVGSDFGDALAATDSAEWLAKHDAEVRAPLEKRIAELSAKGSRRENELLERLDSDTAALREQAKSLEAQLAATTNDAARAELRARDLADGITCRKDWIDHNGDESLRENEEDDACDKPDDCEKCMWVQALAAAPDSDARLREVVGDAIQYDGREVEDLDAAIDEVLGAKS